MISFVIPVKNEQEHIGLVLGSIHDALSGRDVEYEILVADHGSSDRTVELARAGGARVHEIPTAPTIGALRNRGVEKSHGSMLVFLDGDVSLAPDWGERFLATQDLFEKNPTRVSGSEVLAPSDGSLLERIWFGVDGRDRVHLNSGHFIIGRNFFDRLGGFDEALTTGEDHDLTVRAAAGGGAIEPDSRLRVFHHGFPKTYGQFFRREVWHGISTFDSMEQVLTSRVSLITVGLLAVTLGSGIAAILDRRWIWLLLPVLAWLAASLVSAVFRPKRRWLDLPYVGFCYGIYYLARCVSPIARLRKDSHWKS